MEMEMQVFHRSQIILPVFCVFLGRSAFMTCPGIPAFPSLAQLLAGRTICLQDQTHLGAEPVLTQVIHSSNSPKHQCQTWYRDEKSEAFALKELTIWWERWAWKQIIATHFENSEVDIETRRGPVAARTNSPPNGMHPWQQGGAAKLPGLHFPDLLAARHDLVTRSHQWDVGGSEVTTLARNLKKWVCLFQSLLPLSSAGCRQLWDPRGYGAKRCISNFCMKESCLPNRDAYFRLCWNDKPLLHPTTEIYERVIKIILMDTNV